MSDPGISERERLLGEGAAAFVMFSAASQYQVRIGGAIEGLPLEHPHRMTLIATAIALETAQKRSFKWMGRVLKRLGREDVAGGGNRAWVEYMKEIGGFAHLHLEAPLN